MITPNAHMLPDLRLAIAIGSKHLVDLDVKCVQFIAKVPGLRYMGLGTWADDGKSWNSSYWQLG